MARAPKSDPQRERLYHVEHSFARQRQHDRGMTLAQARKLAGTVCRSYGVPPIKILYEYRDNDRFGAYLQHDVNPLANPRLVVNRLNNDLDVRMLLHELSHWIDACYFGADVEHHGPTFVGIAGWLYDKYRVIPAVAFRSVLQASNVRFRKFGLCSPEALKRISRVAP